MGIDLHAEIHSIKDLEKLVGEEVLVEVGTVLRKTYCEDGTLVEHNPATVITYKSRLVDLGKHGIFLEKKEEGDTLGPKNTMILHVDESYVKVPTPRAKTYLPFRDAECVYDEKVRNITYTGILSIKHKDNLVYKRESLC
jgi:hypothetical protein